MCDYADVFNLLTLFIMNKFILISFSLILLSLGLVGCFGSSSTNEPRKTEPNPSYEGYYRFDWGGRPMTLHLMLEDPDSYTHKGIFELYGSTVSGKIRGSYFVGGDILYCTPDELGLRNIYLNVRHDKAGSESGYLWWYDYNGPAKSYNTDHEYCCRYHYTKN